MFKVGDNIKATSKKYKNTIYGKIIEVGTAICDLDKINSSIVNAIAYELDCGNGIIDAIDDYEWNIDYNR